MRNYSPIHGIDFIIDHYEILGVSRDATTDQIRSAYREKSRGLHPDPLANLDETLRAQAALKFQIVTLAHETLSDPKRRERYNKRLDSFDPKLVSKDGTPILDLSRSSIDIEYLVSGRDPEDHANFILMAEQHSGYSEDTFRLIEEQFLATKKPSDALISSYLDQLAKKDAFLSILEDLAWEDAGRINAEQPSGYGSGIGYLAQREEELQSTEEQIGLGIEARVLALASGDMPKLLTDSCDYTGEQAVANPAELQAELSSLALTRFQEHRDEILTKARERSELLDKLAGFTKWEYWPREQEPYDRLMIIPVIGGKTTIGFICSLEGDTVTTQDSIDRYNNMDVDAFKAQVQEDGINVALFHHNENIPLELEIGFVAQTHFTTD